MFFFYVLLICLKFIKENILGLHFVNILFLFYNIFRDVLKLFSFHIEANVLNLF